MDESIALDEVAARALTERIKVAAEELWALLLESHQRRAWDALGYDSWRDYATTEFGMDQRYAYRLLDQARVIRAIEEAANLAHGPKITEREARDLKPHLPQVTKAVRDATAGVDPADLADAVSAELHNQRDLIQAKATERAGRDVARALGDEMMANVPEDWDPEAEKRDISICYTLFRALEGLNKLPMPGSVLSLIPTYEQHKLDDLDHAIEWLSQFRPLWLEKRRTQ